MDLAFVFPLGFPEGLELDAAAPVCTDVIRDTRESNWSISWAFGIKLPANMLSLLK